MVHERTWKPTRHQLVEATFFVLGGVVVCLVGLRAPFFGVSIVALIFWLLVVVGCVVFNLVRGRFFA